MAKIKKVGQALVMTSSITSKDYDRVASFKPSALELKDEKGNVEFKVASNCYASIGNYGIGFDAENKDGYLQITTMSMTETKEDIIENYAVVLAKLNKIEAQVAAALEEVNTLFEDVSGSIEVE